MGTLRLPTAAGLEQAQDLLRAVEGGIDAQGLHVDASALEGFDSSVVALLLHARREAQRRGAPFSLSGAPAKLRELARLYGVDELLPFDTPASTT